MDNDRYVEARDTCMLLFELVQPFFPQTPQSLQRVVKTASYVRQFTTNLRNRTNIQVTPVRFLSSKHTHFNRPLPLRTLASPLAVNTLMHMARSPGHATSSPHSDCTPASGGGHDRLAEHRPLSVELQAASEPRGLDRQVQR